MLRAALFGVLTSALLLGPLGCGGADEEEGASAPDTTNTIPFEKEGELAILQDGDSTVVLGIEIADTDSARERGMMEREGFPDETSGMLFLFENEEPRSFWMANTPVALDILFVGADSQIVHIAKYTTPYSSEQVRSDAPAKYVLETSAGFADSYGILEGDHLRWHRSRGE